MKFYNVTYILKDEQEERLSAIARRYHKINGWNETDVLQFAVTAFTQSDIDTKLAFLESKIKQL